MPARSTVYPNRGILTHRIRSIAHRTPTPRVAAPKEAKSSILGCFRHRRDPCRDHQPGEQFGKNPYEPGLGRQPRTVGTYDLSHVVAP
ncbi:hypothetical protein FAGKG844_1110005 [Frankia sp. AgKG'84/4]